MEKRLRAELAGFGSMKTVEKSRNVFSVISLTTPPPLTGAPL